MQNALLTMTMIHEVHGTPKAVAFTFDDGPNGTYTPQLLEILRAVSGKATFYMIGEQIILNPVLAQTVHAQGHEIGNHTFTHPALTRLPTAEMKRELQRTDQVIQTTTGTRPQTFRPPYLDCNQEVLNAAAELGYRTIGAVNLQARDWEQPGAQHIIDSTLQSTSAGSILLFHDGYGDRSQTVEAVAVLAHELTQQGYQLVTVSELLTSGVPASPD